MLYSFSKATYHPNELADILAQVSADDAVLLWQDGVLQAVKSPQLFAHLPRVFVLETDITARGLTTDLKSISLAELVSLTENYFPQLAF